MNTYSFHTDTNISEYDDFLSSLEISDIFSDSTWREVSAAKGWKKNILFSLKSGGEIVAIAQGYLNESKYFGPYLYIQHGPLIKSSSPANASNWGEWSLDHVQSELVSHFLDEIKNYALDQDAFAVVLEPLATQSSDMAKQIYKAGYQQQKRSILPRYPMFMDLELGEEELIAKLSKSTRYNIRQAEKKGVMIRAYTPGSDADVRVIEKFYSLLASASKSKEYDIPPLKFFTTAWERYTDKNKIAFVVAEYEGQIVSANFSQFYGNWAGSYYTANSREHSRLNASYLLKWQTILEAKRRAKKVFDMWGYIPGLKPGDSEYGYGEFKKGFSPLEKEFCGRLILPLNVFKYSTWKLLGGLKYMLG